MKASRGNTLIMAQILLPLSTERQGDVCQLQLTGRWPDSFWSRHSSKIQLKYSELRASDTSPEVAGEQPRQWQHQAEEALSWQRYPGEVCRPLGEQSAGAFLGGSPSRINLPLLLSVWPVS
jgi:hypothetical protein